MGNLTKSFLFIVIIIFSSCEKADEHDKYKPEFQIKITQYDNGDKYYDNVSPFDTFRIGGFLYIYVNFVANGQTNAYIKNLTIKNKLSNKIVFDSIFNSYQERSTIEIPKPIEEGITIWNLQIIDNIGNHKDTTIQFFCVNKGLLGNWLFSSGDIRGSFDTINFVDPNFLRMSFSNDGSFSIWNNHQTFHGQYNQEKDNKNNRFQLNQFYPDTIVYEGLFKVSGARKDSILLYYVQTQPDIGVDPPQELRIEGPFEEGEFFIKGKYLN